MLKKACNNWHIKKDIDAVAKNQTIDAYFSDLLNNDFQGHSRHDFLITHHRLTKRPNEKFVQHVGQGQELHNSYKNFASMRTKSQ